MTTTMTVTRALAELKLLDKRITKTTTESVFVDLYQERKKLGRRTSKPIADFEKNAKEAYTSIRTLIARRRAIKVAITESNASTMVVIAADKMAVSEAIERKISLEYSTTLLAALREQARQAKEIVEKERAVLQSQVQTMLEKNLGGDKKPNEGDYEAIAKPFFEANEPKIADPIGIDARIAELEKEIEDFESNVDFVLSESNAKTTIEVE